MQWPLGTPTMELGLALLVRPLWGQRMQHMPQMKSSTECGRESEGEGDRVVLRRFYYLL